MTVRYVRAVDSDKNVLAQLRVVAMQESLEAVGRFDPVRARDRLLARFVADHTWKIIVADQLVGFYSFKIIRECLWLDDLYINPASQRTGLGADVINLLKHQAASSRLPIRLGALRGSSANRFYLSHGFVVPHEDAWDIFYEYPCDLPSR